MIPFLIEKVEKLLERSYRILSSLSINPKRLFAITTLRFPSFARKQRYARGWTINVRNLSPLKDPFGVQTSRDAKVLKACSSFFHQLYCYFRKLVAGAGNYTLTFFEFLTDEEFPAGNSKSPYPCAILEFAPWIEFTPIIISVEANRRVLR